MFEVDVIRVVTPCSVVLEYQRFGEPCCLHLQGEVVGIGRRRHRYRSGLENVSWRNKADNYGLGSSSSRYGPVVNAYDEGNEPLGTIKEEFLDKPSDYLLLNYDCAPWS
jgi:hypothetical protein